MDGSVLDSIPCTSYYRHIYDNKMITMFSKGKAYLNTQGGKIDQYSLKRSIRRTERMNQAILEIWVDDPVKNQRRIVDVLSLDVSDLKEVGPKANGSNSANDVKMTFTMSNRGRLRVTMEDNITLESTTSTVMLRDVGVGEFHEAEKYYANRQKAERLMAEVLKKGNGENAVAVRREIRTILENISAGVEFIGLHEMQQLEKTLLELEERLHNL